MTGNAGGGTNNTVTAFPVNGSLTFTVDGDGPGTVVPFVYVDGGQGGTGTTGGTDIRLETSATVAGQFAAVTETFGVGGATTYVARQADNGNVGADDADTTNGVQNNPVPVTAVDKTAGAFTTGTGGATRRFNFDTNDLFFVNGVSVGIDAFRAALSSGDSVTGVFTRDVAGVSQFSLTDSNPQVVAATATPQGGANSRNIVVTATFTEDVDQIVVQRATVTGAASDGTGGAPGTFATIATVAATDVDTATNGTQVSYTDVNVPLGVYQYRIAAINDGQTGAFGTASANASSTSPAADAQAPVAQRTTLITDGGFANVLDAGDVFTVQANEALAAPANGSSIRVSDIQDATTNPVASVADLVCGTNATCALNAAAIPATPTTNPNAGAAAGTVLTVTITAAPTVVTVGSSAGVALPAAIINTAGVTDVAGNRISLVTASGVTADARIDNNA